MVIDEAKRERRSIFYCKKKKHLKSKTETENLNQLQVTFLLFTLQFSNAWLAFSIDQMAVSHPSGFSFLN